MPLFPFGLSQQHGCEFPESLRVSRIEGVRPRAIPCGACSPIASRQADWPAVGWVLGPIIRQLPFTDFYILDIRDYIRFKIRTQCLLRSKGQPAHLFPHARTGCELHKSRWLMHFEARIRRLGVEETMRHATRNTSADTSVIAAKHPRALVSPKPPIIMATTTGPSADARF